jgi:SAM-dependent methyltransferase
MALLENLRNAPDRGAAVASYAKLAPKYDATCHWLDRIRTEALGVLNPREGETILDVACGTGAMLPVLARAVGSRGRVIGIEQCPEMAAIARRRITDAGLENVILVVAPVEDADIGATADAILFCYTHDVLQSDRAVARVLSCARPGARVVAAGARLLGWWAAPVNLWKLWRSRNYLSTYRGLRDPSANLARRCENWRVVATHALGTSYLACGTCRGRAA